MTMTNTRTYRGPALVITDNGDSPIDVELWTEHSRGLASWRGTVTADPHVDLWAVIENREGKLRLPNGEEGTFIPVRHNVAGRMSIAGSGPAPF